MYVEKNDEYRSIVKCFSISIVYPCGLPLANWRSHFRTAKALGKVQSREAFRCTQTLLFQSDFTTN